MSNEEFNAELRELLEEIEERIAAVQGEAEEALAYEN